MATSLRLLGPLEATIDGFAVTPRAAKERALLALLIVNHGNVVSADRLVEELWPALPVDHGRRVLQVRVAALRKILRGAKAASLLEYVPPGYRLAVAAEDVDTHQFALLVEQAHKSLQAGDSRSAAATFRDALSLWRGDPFEDMHGCVGLQAEGARLAEQRLGTIEDWIEAELACGSHHAMVAELEALVAAHPFRENLQADYVLALYRCGRQAEALRACTAVRQRLVAELGIQPGPALRGLESAVLEQRPELDWSAPVSRPDRATTTSSQAGQAGLPTVPAVRYATTNDGLRIAYQVAGHGDFDLIIVPGFTSHLSVWWETWPKLATRLSSFCRLIVFDKRGTGLSDRPPGLGTGEWMEDIRAVLDAVGSERPAILGMSAGGTVAILFAATYPERTRALVLVGARARYLYADDYRICSMQPEDVESLAERVESKWGTGVMFRAFCPSAADNPVEREKYARFQQVSASPGAAGAYLRALLHMDVRHALPMVQAPTLVLHATRDRSDPVEQARYMAERIPGATMIELDSDDHLIWLTDALEQMSDEIQDFLTAATPTQNPQRALATIMFVDLAGRHDELIADEKATRRSIEQFRGRPVRSGEGGILAAFDGPTRAIECAWAIVAGYGMKKIEVRAGLHCGECETSGNEVTGVAVEIARRAADRARSGQVLVSQTLRDVVFGSTITFSDTTSANLQGLGRQWRTYAVTGVG